MKQSRRFARFWVMMLLCMCLGLVGCADKKDDQTTEAGNGTQVTEENKGDAPAASDADETDDIKEPDETESDAESPSGEESTEADNSGADSSTEAPSEEDKTTPETDQAEDPTEDTTDETTVETTPDVPETTKESVEGTTEQDTPPETETPEETQPADEGTSDFVSLSQTEIVAAMGAGWNLGNQLEAVNNKMPGETNWGNPVITKELITLVKQAGFQSIRVPVSYLNMIGPGPDYQINEAWLERIAQVVDYCIENDLYVVINIHGDGYYTIDGGWLLCGESNQEEIREKYKAVWHQIATYFKDYDEHLIFESMNEVFDGSYNTPNRTRYENINRYNQIFVDTVRTSGGNNDQRWLIVPGWNTDINYTAGNYGFTIPTDEYRSSKIPAGEQRIMISVHYYSPWDFCGTENGNVTQWGNEVTDHSKEAGYDKESDMVSKFKKLYSVFISKGYPVFIGEYGAIDKTSYDASNNYYRAYFLKRLCELSQQYGCIPMYWDNGYNGVHGFGLFNRTTKQITQQELIDAMVGVYRPELLQGNATGVTLDVTNATLKIGETVTLTATMSPAGAKDVVSFTSANAAVATVSPMGVVTATGTGTTTITATTRSGKTATCQVTVEAASTVSVKLYLMETVNWTTLESAEIIEIPTTGGTFTCTMSIPQASMEAIGSLYFKDVLVYGGQAASSLYKSVTIRLDAVKVNGNACGILTGEEEAITGNGVFDYCLINRWDVASAKLDGFQVNSETENYYYPGAAVTNQLEVTFTITSVEK